MTIDDKLQKIDQYLSESHIDPDWREMIVEYKSMLISKQLETEENK